MLSVGCHVSIAGGVWNAAKNAADLECEVFQIFTRPPQGGAGGILGEDEIKKFQAEMDKYGYSYSHGDSSFVVHSPYYINFGSSDNRIYHGSINIITQELIRANLLGARFVMTHLGSFKNAKPEDVMEHVKKGLVQVLEDYENAKTTNKEARTPLLLEIAAGGGNIIGDTFEELAEIMEPLTKFKTFGGICFDTQHAFASGYDLRDKAAVELTFKKFDKEIGLKWLKMSHINDSKPDFGSHRDRHEHLGEGKIGTAGFEALLGFLQKNLKSKILNHKSEGANNLSTRRPGRSLLSLSGETNNVAFGTMPLILETEHDKVEKDIKLLKNLRDKLK